MKMVLTWITLFSLEAFATEHALLVHTDSHSQNNNVNICCSAKGKPTVCRSKSESFLAFSAPGITPKVLENPNRL